MEVRRYEIVVKTEKITDDESIAKKTNRETANLQDANSVENVIEKKDTPTFNSVAVKGLATATLAVGTYQTVRNMVNTQKTATLVINGDLLAAQHLQIRQSNIDKYIGLGGTAMKGAFAGGVVGSVAGPVGTVVGAAVGTIYSVASSVFKQVNTHIAEMRVYEASIKQQQYYNQLEANRLIKSTGRVR